MALTRPISDYKDSVKAATTGSNITLVGGAPTSLDGISLSVNDRVLVKDQTDNTQNGIYRVATLGSGSNGTWTRTGDFNDWRTITSGALTFVEQGSINGNVFYYIPGGEPNVTVGSTGISFSNLFSFLETTNTLQTVTNAGNTTTNSITAASFTASNGGQYIGYHTGAIGANTPNTIVATSVTTVSGGQLSGYLTGAIGANTANTGNFSSITITGSGGNITGTNTGYIVSSYLVANNNIYANSYLWYNNNAPLATTITGTYSNSNVSAYLPTYTGTLSPSNLTTYNGGQISGYLTGAIGANTPNTIVATSVTTTSGGQLSGYLTGAIGANTANTGAFTTVTITNGANSYGSGQGALQISGGFYAGGDSYIAGNLVVGNINSVGYNSLVANAPLLYLSANSIISYNYEIGFYSHKYDSIVGYNHTGVIRNHLDNSWYFFSNIRTEPTSVVDLANASLIYDTVKMGNAVVYGNIVGGYITGAIGANGANSGAFTTITTTGSITGGNQVTGYLNGALGANTPNSIVATSVTTSSGGQVTGYLTGAIGANTANSGVFTNVNANGLTINSSAGNYNVLNISGTALAPYGTPQTWQFFTNNTSLGGVGSFIKFPDSSTQTTAYPGSTTSLTLQNLNGYFTGAIGANTPNTGVFTTVTTSGTITSGNQLVGYLNGALGANSANTGAFTTITSTGSITSGNQVLGYVTGAIGANTPNSGIFTSISTTTSGGNGNVTIGGNLTISPGGNIYFGSTPVGRFYSGNTAPTSPNLGDRWYQGNVDILFEYIQDAANNKFWLDLTSNPSSYGNLTVSNTLTINGNLSAAVSSLNITGGSLGYVLRTDGNGNLSWVAVSATAGGANTNVQFNDSGSISGATYLQYNKTSGNLVSTSITSATSTTTGALVLSGGAGIGGSLYVGNIVTTSGIFYPNGATAGGGAGGANTMVQFNDGATISGSTYLQYNKTSGNLVSNSTTQSTSTTTGALVLAGGLGVGGNIYAANILIGSTTTLTGVQNIGLIPGSSAYLTIMGARLGDTGSQVTGVGALEIQGSSGSGSGIQSKIDFVDKIPGGNSLVNSARISVTNSATATNVGQLVFSTYNGSSLVEAMRIYENGNIITPSTTTITNGTLSAVTVNANTIGNTGSSIVGAVATNAQPFITSVGTLTGLTVSGTTNLQGTTNGATINATTVQGGTIGNTGTTLTGTLSTAAQTNITSVGTLTGLTVSGTTNLQGTTNGATINATTVQGGTIGNSGATLTGTLSTAAQTNITSVGTLTGLTVSGTTNLQGTTNGATINATTVQGGTIGNSGATLTGTLSTAAQTNITSVGALTSLTMAGAINGQTINGTSILGTTIGNTASAINGNIHTGSAIYAGTIGNTGATLTGTLSTAAQTNITSVGILTGLTVSGTTNLQGTTNGTTINATTIQGGTIGNTGATLTGTLSTAAQTNITSVGTLTGLTVSGTTNLQGTTNGATINATSLLATTIGNSSSAGTFSTITSSTHTPSSNNAVTLGSASAYWSTCYAVTFTGTSTTAKYADLAEMYHADAYYAPGTVMIFGGDLDVTVSTRTHDTAVAGVVSTNPAYLMNDNFEHDNWLPIALTGRVPCMVRGPVAKGTLLVSSNIKGVACALDKSLYEPGCIIGKSMDIITDGSIKKIEIAVGRF